MNELPLPKKMILGLKADIEHACFGLIIYKLSIGADYFKIMHPKPLTFVTFSLIRVSADTSFAKLTANLPSLPRIHIQWPAPTPLPLFLFRFSRIRTRLPRSCLSILHQIVIALEE